MGIIDEFRSEGVETLLQREVIPSIVATIQPWATSNLLGTTGIGQSVALLGIYVVARAYLITGKIRAYRSILSLNKKRQY